jgi:lipopolysaccharide export system ATP-binding protein
VEKSFGGRMVVKGVSSMYGAAKRSVCLGPNGAGKTTVFYMITGLIRPTAAAIELDGHDVTKLPMYQRARLGIGYLPQEASIFRGLTVEENIRAVLEVVEPDKRRARPISMHCSRNSTSRGCARRRRSRCRAASAAASRSRARWRRGRATCCSTNRLPASTRSRSAIFRHLVRHLTNRGIGVLITDHNVRETLGLTDRAYIIYSGRGLDRGPPDEIVNNPDVRGFIWARNSGFKGYPRKRPIFVNAAVYIGGLD